MKKLRACWAAIREMIFGRHIEFDQAYIDKQEANVRARVTSITSRPMVADEDYVHRINADGPYSADVPVGSPKSFWKIEVGAKSMCSSCYRYSIIGKDPYVMSCAGHRVTIRMICQWEDCKITYLTDQELVQR